MIEETLNVFVAPRERLPSRFSKRTEAEPESEE
jgi:hypothetical protein